MSTLLEVRDLMKYYPEVKAVDGVSFAIEEGTCFGLLGPNGAGKTTTIEVIEGILPPASGEILYRGEPRRTRFREEVGIQLQNTELPQYLTVRETLETFRNLYSKRADITDLIDSCQLHDILDRDNRKISGGQKQRLLLAIALANDPDLIFLDEPTTGLDPQARRHVWDIVDRIRSEGKTVILTTHYMDEAEILCDRIAIMDMGKIIANDSPRLLLQQYAGVKTIILRSDIDDRDLGALPCSWYRFEDRIEIHTGDLNVCMQELMRSRVDLSGINVRSPNLEDLFLDLTGRELRA